MKKELKKILINVCIEKERLLPIKGMQRDHAMSLEGSLPATPDLCNDREIIDSVRKMAFLPRTIYNMSVIDGYKDAAIALALGVPAQDIGFYVMEVRRLMMGWFDIATPKVVDQI